MKYFLRGMVIGVWLLIALFVTFMVFTSSHLVLAVIASHIALPRWLFFGALRLSFLVPVAVLLFVAVLIWKRKLPGL
jgi:hypothetical protein